MIPDDTPYGRDNCGIAAVAMLAKVSYHEAEHLFFNLCRCSDITSIWDRMLVIDALGLTVTEEFHYKDKPTLYGWYKCSYDPSHDYHVTITGHAIAVRKGKVFDPQFRQGIDLPISPHKRKRVSSFLRLGVSP
jgi:hypothetical protein